MAIIPLKQTILIAKSTGSYDGWGQPITVEPVILKARVTETTKVVKTQTGEEAVATLWIILDKLADISYNDTVTYTNELGVTVARKPINIGIKRMMSGKAIITEVFV